MRSPWSLALAASVAQALLLAGVTREPSDLVAALACAAVLGVAVAVSARVPNRALHVATMTGSYGGLAMLSGTLLDRVTGFSTGACHSPELGVRSFANWMTVLMLPTCLAAGVAVSPRCGARRHVACLASMWLGMTFGGRWLGPCLRGTFDELISDHLGMLAGMMFGGAIAHLAYVHGGRRDVPDSTPHDHPA